MGFQGNHLHAVTVFWLFGKCGPGSRLKETWSYSWLRWCFGKCISGFKYDEDLFGVSMDVIFQGGLTAMNFSTESWTKSEPACRHEAFQASKSTPAVRGWRLIRDFFMASRRPTPAFCEPDPPRNLLVEFSASNKGNRWGFHISKFYGKCR